jgi:tetrahydromethanopterin S-methyltransferase subunit G
MKSQPLKFTARLLAGFIVFLSFAVLGQGFIPGAPQSNGNPPPMRFEDMAQVSEDSKIRVAKGFAPLYVRAQVYANYLEAGFSQDSKIFFDVEASKLLLNPQDFNWVIHKLQSVITRDAESKRNRLLQECIPVLGGDSVSNQEAREVVERIDNYESYSNEIVENIIQEIGSELGEDAAKVLRARIFEFGSAVMFTKVDMIKFIDQTLGGDFVGYLNNRCATL